MLLPHSSGRSKVRKEGKLIEFGVGLPLNISIDWNITKAVADLSFRIAKSQLSDSIKASTDQSPVYRRQWLPQGNRVKRFVTKG